jgi:multidrug efflux pump
MNRLIEASFQRSRTVLLALVLVLLAGAQVYHSIPKESDPDVQLPVVYVLIPHEGISPEDAERLLVRPMEQELRGLEGIKEMRSYASEGSGSITMEFDAGTDIDEALQDVRERVDQAKPELPEGSEEPEVSEVNLALFPVLVVTLSGDVPERTLLTLARDLERPVEALANVLEVDIAGEREELLEIVIDPSMVDSYGLELNELLGLVSRNNQLIAAGALDTGDGRFAVKVPGVFETGRDVLNLPIKVVGGEIVRLRDVAEVRRTFKDPEGFARVDGQPALALEVKKRIGTNIVDTVEQVRAVVEAERADWPDNVQVSFLQDKSDDIASMLRDLQNNVISAILLVMMVIVAALGLRSAGLVGLAVPGSFLAGILVLGSLGLTVNIVVLFALILSTGMLVDGAIIVTELADRKMAEGMDRRDAYLLASKRMAWPIAASTATTLAAFLPLLFWPGVVGEFMKFLPITLIATLSASLLMALIFLPNLGALIGKPETTDPRTMKLLSAAEEGDLGQLRGLSGAYVRLLRRLLRRPAMILLAAIATAAGSYAAYGVLGRGIEFFPDVEPEVARVQVRARGDLSVHQRDDLVREVENRVLGIDGIDTIYTRSALSFPGQDVDEDVIGVLLLEFHDWQERRPAAEIFADIRERTAGLAGLQVEIHEAEAGPPVGKPIQVELTSRFPERLEPAIAELRAFFDRLDGITDVTDSRPMPGIEWRFVVDREQAGRFGADIAVVGSAIQLVTNGILVDEYRPEDATDEVDIRARYPESERSLEQLERLRVNTAQGSTPIGNFVTRVPAPKVGTLERVDGARVLEVAADVQGGVLPDDKVREIRAWLAEHPLDPSVIATFKGEDEEQREAEAFLTQAFAVALFLIALILVTQFNSFYQTLLILSAVVFSTVGVMLGLLVVQQPFGIIMSGVGVIALAGIVVNNNIVLIDTYNELRKRGLEPFDAVLRTAAQRLRPVLLTTVTTVLGLMPMVLKINVDLVARDITFGGPSTDWWSQLATAVAGGLAFATLLTLVLTPCLLLLGHDVSSWLAARRAKRSRTAAEPAAGWPEPVPDPAE